MINALKLCINVPKTRFCFVVIVGTSGLVMQCFFFNYNVNAEDYERGLLNLSLSWTSSGRKKETRIGRKY